ncbi:hypothetical protein Esi_0000_0485 [Ectocarpus siliculosus]|uniref:Secreted protein n=1 Tax=Ectocarpus siliculosus TaxID=2880 RepID=D8LBJ2_ECTSI|nr:hypothetical protein Esi_0000_0485 [Ectocarpus siliculosus]|eukprot:CBN76701.1 hypothetical protein Esi_0000_0485 [Ectocarpus siliculosus]
MKQHLVVACLCLLASVDGSAPLLARPAPVQRAGFIVNEGGSKIVSGDSSSSSGSNVVTEEAAATPERPSFVSVGIRSGCAREKAATTATLRNKDRAGTSAASRLRGGSTWIPNPPVMVRESDTTPKTHNSAAEPVSSHPPTGASGSSSCHSRHGAEFAVSKQRIVDDSDSDTDSSFVEDEDQGGVAGSGGGGGGGRVGALPSFPRTLPATHGKAPFNKKFAWVP